MYVYNPYGRMTERERLTALEKAVSVLKAEIGNGNGNGNGNQISFPLENGAGTAILTGETYFGQPVWLRTWTGRVGNSGDVCEVSDFFPENSKVVDIIGTVDYVSGGMTIDSPLWKFGFAGKLDNSLETNLIPDRIPVTWVNARIIVKYIIEPPT
jgi:hypothetical protein